jgi:tungstate transport system substrate-binding protein
MDKQKLVYVLIAIVVVVIAGSLINCLFHTNRSSPALPAGKPAQGPPGGAQAKQRVVLRIATTTSLDATGLLDAVKKSFEAKYPWIEVTWVSVGTGQAIEIGRRGDADMLIVHNRELENQFISEGYGVHGITFAYNDFVLLGPPEDPAGVKGAKGAVEAFKAIFQAAERGKAVFVSRGDKSGTNLRELLLWSQAGVKPAGKPWYKETGQGMAQTLMVADQLGAYTLCDRSTFLAFKDKIHLAILNEGDPLYLNLYRAIPVNPKRLPNVHYNESLLFVSFLVSPEGQRVIGTYAKNGAKMFNVCFGNLTRLGIYDPYEYDEESGQVKFYRELLARS